MPYLLVNLGPLDYFSCHVYLLLYSVSTDSAIPRTSFDSIECLLSGLLQVTSSLHTQNNFSCLHGDVLTKYNLKKFIFISAILIQG